MNSLITPQDQALSLAEALKVQSLVLKREDLHPLKSHKGRSIPTMIDHALSKGVHRFALSSSGNAAIAACLYVQSLLPKYPGLALEVYAGNNINKDKLFFIQGFQSKNIQVIQTERPKQALLEATKRGFQSLRQSIDPLALVGYSSLVEELLHIKDLQAVFLGTSSGTTAQALHEGFVKAGRKIQIHAVQTTSCHPIANDFKQNTTVVDTGEPSIADAIVDSTSLRKLNVVQALQQSGGYCWIVDNDSIKKSQDVIFETESLRVSPNGALGVAGMMVAQKAGWTWTGTVVCIVCGQ